MSNIINTIVDMLNQNDKINEAYICDSDGIYTFININLKDSYTGSVISIKVDESMIIIFKNGCNDKHNLNDPTVTLEHIVDNIISYVANVIMRYSIVTQR